MGRFVLLVLLSFLPACLIDFILVVVRLVGRLVVRLVFACRLVVLRPVVSFPSCPALSFLACCLVVLRRRPSCVSSRRPSPASCVVSSRPVVVSFASCLLVVPSSCVLRRASSVFLLVVCVVSSSCVPLSCRPALLSSRRGVPSCLSSGRGGRCDVGAG